MPNYMKNKIMAGRRDIIDSLVEKYCFRNENGEIEFDFNRLIPMPDDLKIEFSSKSEHALSLYMTRICPDVDYYGDKKDKVSSSAWEKTKNMIESHMIMCHDLFDTKDEVADILRKYKGQEEELLDLGKRQVENVKNHGALNWYEWAIENWGTKWNSSGFEVSSDGKAILFDTAWDPAVPIFVELTKQNPQYKFALLYSDEEIGAHTGYMMAQAGRVDFEGRFKDMTYDSYKLAFDLWGCEDEYVYDEEKHNFFPIDDIQNCKEELCL